MKALEDPVVDAVFDPDEPKSLGDGRLVQGLEGFVEYTGLLVMEGWINMVKDRLITTKSEYSWISWAASSSLRH